MVFGICPRASHAPNFLVHVRDNVLRFHCHRRTLGYHLLKKIADTGLKFNLLKERFGMKFKRSAKRLQQI